MKMKLMVTSLVLPILLPRLIASEASKSIPSEEERSLLAMEDEWDAAEIKKDEPALRRILDDQYLVVYSSGKMADKNAFIAGIMRSSMVAFSVKRDYVRIDGDTAVVVAELSVEGIPSRTRCMYIAVKRDGRWRPIAEQLTKVTVAESK